MLLLSFALVLFVEFMLSSVQSKAVSLTPFGKAVEECLPEDTRSKTFNQNFKSVEELQLMADIVSKKYVEVIGYPVDACLIEKIQKAGILLIKNKEKDGLFISYTNALSNTLKNLGKLNSKNVHHLARKYVQELNKAAKNVTDDNSIVQTVTALVVGTAEFLKCEGVHSPAGANEFIKCLTEEFDDSNKPKKNEDQSSKHKFQDWFNDGMDLMRSIGGTLSENLSKYLTYLIPYYLKFWN